MVVSDSVGRLLFTMIRGICVYLIGSENQVVLVVSDNGIGFPESTDPVNLKSLGMELVNILVGQLNGSIDMQVDSGTTWTIKFPLKNYREWRNG